MPYLKSKFRHYTMEDDRNIQRNLKPSFYNEKVHVKKGKTIFITSTPTWGQSQLAYNLPGNKNFYEMFALRTQRHV